MGICCCFCSQDPTPRFQPWNQAFGVPVWTACSPEGCEVPRSALWRAGGLSQFLCLTCSTLGRENSIKTKPKQMWNIWPICKCCIWGYLFLRIFRARGGVLVCSFLGYLSALLSIKCNCFFYLKGSADDLRWTEELPFSFCVSAANNYTLPLLLPAPSLPGCCPRSWAPTCTNARGLGCPRQRGFASLCWIHEVLAGPFLQPVVGPQ